MKSKPNRDDVSEDNLNRLETEGCVWWFKERQERNKARETRLDEAGRWRMKASTKA